MDRPYRLLRLALLTLSASLVVPLTVHAAAWDVSVVSTNLDTVWVDVRVTGLIDPSPCLAQTHCAEVWNDVFCNITPCPLRPSDCDENIGVYTLNPSGYVRVPLQNGIEYTISGYYLVVTTERDSHGNCAVEACRYSEVPPDKIFKATPLAVQPITWGAVKSMYRRL